jgi:hypothetical protein
LSFLLEKAQNPSSGFGFDSSKESKSSQFQDSGSDPKIDTWFQQIRPKLPTANLAPGSSHLELVLILVRVLISWHIRSSLVLVLSKN